MQIFSIKRGLDIPIIGAPPASISGVRTSQEVAIIGDDYIGMKPSMNVTVGEMVKAGQLLFVDKKNEGVKFVSPAAGRVKGIIRGEKRKFTSLVIEKIGDEKEIFIEESELENQLSEDKIKELLIDSGNWLSFKTRPFGKTPAISDNPHSLFITAIDTEPLAHEPQVIIAEKAFEFQKGLKVLNELFSCDVHYCSGKTTLLPCEQVDGFHYSCWQGPHPAGLPSTHIHNLDPASEKKTVWQIGYQDVIAIGHLFLYGTIAQTRFVAVVGPNVIEPQLLEVPIGCSLTELCQTLKKSNTRLLSGSAISGRIAEDETAFLGRYHNQVCLLDSNDGHELFNWLRPGSDRFSALPIFTSSLSGGRKLPMPTAMWGGKRAIYPVASYDEVMPLDILPSTLLKSILNGQTDLSKDLGCLEIVEEDLALCSYVCPGKNEFGPALRDLLTAIENGD
ncbi:MAG: Na(+)-translocating NADH-quinone reductase subunit A [Desulfotalea sp.]